MYYVISIIKNEIAVANRMLRLKMKSGSVSEQLVKKFKWGSDVYVNWHVLKTAALTMFDAWKFEEHLAFNTMTPDINPAPYRNMHSLDNIQDKTKSTLEAKTLKSRKSGYTEDNFSETSYYIENGLRKVYPYYSKKSSYTKEKWIGEKVRDVFAGDFRAEPRTDYEKCIRTGSFTVNNEKVDPDYRLKKGDLLSHLVHRHEVPVTSQPITIVHVDKDILVVNKPASIPVHPCGTYRHNSMIFILAKEYNLKNLLIIHRLDRLTSGILMFGRSPNRVRQLREELSLRLVQKEYMCRVEGEFPESELECREPLKVVGERSLMSHCRVSPEGKRSSTVFQRLGYNAKNNTSVVLCKPRTGRMHQIRVHLQYLGYPIVNDTLYNDSVFGPLRGMGGDTGGKTEEEVLRDLIAEHDPKDWLLTNAADNDVLMSKRVSDGKATHPGVGHALSDPDCYDCRVRYRDPDPSELIMYLHAWRYKGPGWEYETELPEWANVDWEEQENS